MQRIWFFIIIIMSIIRVCSLMWAIIGWFLVNKCINIYIMWDRDTQQLQYILVSLAHPREPSGFWTTTFLNRFSKNWTYLSVQNTNRHICSDMTVQDTHWDLLFESRYQQDQTYYSRIIHKLMHRVHRCQSPNHPILIVMMAMHTLVIHTSADFWQSASLKCGINARYNRLFICM